MSKKGGTYPNRGGSKFARIWHSPAPPGAKIVSFDKKVYVGTESGQWKRVGVAK